jgi:hypothetical protein
MKICWILFIIFGHELPEFSVQAINLEVKKLACKPDTEIIEVINCSLQSPTKQSSILHLRVLFIKEVKDLTVKSPRP